MTERITELLYRNLQEVFGEGDAAPRRAAIEDFYTDDCVLYVADGVVVGHDALDQICRGTARDPSAFCLYAPWSGPGPAQRGNSCVGLGPKRGAARVHGAGCSRCSREQDRCAL
jgi:hypothetical protein